MNAEADVSLEKINLGNDVIRIQTDQAIPVVDVQLLENTDQCLANCYAILKIHPYQDIALPAQADSDFAWKFEKEKPWMDGLVSHHFELLETTEYAVDVPDYERRLVNTTCYHEDNSTYECEVEQTVQTGSHQETRYRDEYKPFAFWGETLKANQDYTMKLVGKKHPQLGTNNVDWIPTMKGLEINDWQWWNASQCNSIRKIISNATTYNTQININDTSFPNYWTRNATSTTASIYLYKCAGNYYFVANETDEMDWENGTSRTGNSSKNVFSSAYAVWHLDEESGTTVYDSTAGGYIGTLTGTEAWNASGVFGGSLTFNGTASRKVLFMDTSAAVEGQNYTIELYALGYRTTTAGWEDIIFCSNAGDVDEVRIGRQPDGILQFSTYSGTAGNVVSTFNMSNGTNINRWHHIVVARNATDGAKVYVDGAMCGQGQVKDVDAADITNCSLAIKWATTTFPFNGSIDEVRLYNWTMSEAEILDHYNNGINNLTSLGPEENQCPSDDTYINQDTKFEQANMFCNFASYFALQIVADDVTLDCNGMTLNGVGATVGINIAADNVTIKNCTVQNFGEGIINDAHANVSIYNSTVVHNAVGMFFNNPNCRNLISGCNVSFNNNYGIDLEDCIKYPTDPGFENNITIINSVMKSNGLDLEGGNVEVVSVNSTFDTAYIQRNLTVQLLVRANVTDRNMSAIGDAEVTSEDKFGTGEWTFATDSNGLTGWGAVTYFINNSGLITYHNPHSFTASSPTFGQNTTLQNITECQTVHVVIYYPEITFNVTSGEDGSSLNNVNIACNYSGFSQGGDTTNTYGPYEFPPGWWSCTFSRSNYYSKDKVFLADYDKTVDVTLSYQKDMTIEEHNWLEAIYNCLYSGDCLALNLLFNINETTEKTWNQFKRTDQTIVTNEELVSTVVNSTNNITINYTVNVPTKEGYGLIEGIQGYDDFLPIRVHYWFLDENNETCYSQGNYSVAMAEPYCQPLTIYTVGQINTALDFVVDLRPSLSEGTYNIVRSIEIDPENVWIEYGQEIIGQIKIAESQKEPLTGVRGNGKIMESYNTEPASVPTEEPQTSEQDSATGMITVQQIDSVSYIAVIVSVITLILVGLMLRNSRNPRKRTPWGN